jgi:hypothetical protein
MTLVGVQQDFEKAYFWLSLAASAPGYSDKGDSYARENLLPPIISARDEAARHLTRSKLLQVEEQTARFLTTHPKSF